ncbi:MAG TPA: dienelactone hydrolase, partial [Rhodoglobus sp.]|nr:dienelactone hydrolase [Rhodoglobus sp.]
YTATLVLGHGAGAAMDSAGMNDAARVIASRGIRVARFEFAYMAGRREGVRKPPPRADTLLGEYRDVVAQAAVDGPVFIGGRSMGGRVASMVADELHEAGTVLGLVCLGYPFHPPGKPEQLRTAHLEHLATPALIVQGTRDEFGTRDEVSGYALSPSIELVWLEDGDHGLRPRKAVSGFTYAQHLESMADAVAGFVGRVS